MSTLMKKTHRRVQMCLVAASTHVVVLCVCVFASGVAAGPADVPRDLLLLQLRRLPGMLTRQTCPYSSALLLLPPPLTPLSVL